MDDNKRKVKSAGIHSYVVDAQWGIQTWPRSDQQPFCTE